MKIKNLTKLIIISATVSFLPACSTTLKAGNLNEQGYFDTGSTLKPSEVILTTEFDPKFKKFAYVKTDEKNTKLNGFYLDTFKNMGVFDKVVSKPEMEAKIIGENYTANVSNISDKIGLNSLYKVMGDFLVIEPYAEHVAGYDFKATLKAYDPATGKEVFHVENKATNWAGLDKPLFFPLFNAFIDWTQNRPIQTKETTDEKK